MMSSSPATNDDSTAAAATTVLNWEPIRKQLLGADLTVALQAAKELRESCMEIVHTTEFPSFLRGLLPALSTILTRLRPNPDVSSVENQLRNSVLELISKLPNNEVLRPHTLQILQVSMDVLQKDYEDNAFLASRIIFDLHKNFRPMHQDQVQPFLDFVQQVYRNLPTAVQRNFTAEKTPSSITASTKLALKSISSFRVLTECPLTVMLLFQLYPKFLKTNIPLLINLMVDALGLRPPPGPFSSRAQQLLAAQSKTLSFLTYLLRGFHDQMSVYKDKIASCIIGLMVSCPPECVTIRKELLVSTRHVLATDFSSGFLKFPEKLLDETLVFGCSIKKAPLAIQPLAYSTLADYCHFVKSLLSVEQLSRVVHTFSVVLHNVGLSTQIQISATRLLLNLADVAFHNKHTSAQPGRDLLLRILATLTDKLGSWRYIQNGNDAIGTVTESSKTEKAEITVEKASDKLKQDRDEKPNTRGKKKKDDDDAMDVDDDDNDKMDTEDDAALPYQKVPSVWRDVMRLDSHDSPKDTQALVRYIVAGLKTVIWYIHNYRHQRENLAKENAAIQNELLAMQSMTPWERDWVDKYIQYALPCLKQVFDGHESYKDNLAFFASAFSIMDGYNMKKTIGKHMDLLFRDIVDDGDVMMVPRHILASNASASFEFSKILLDFLVHEKMAELTYQQKKPYVFMPTAAKWERHEECKKELLAKETAESQELAKKRASTVLLLFERVLKTLTAYPENEQALRPYLQTIVATCLANMMHEPTSCSEKKDNNSSCTLLIIVFRSISAGKFEESYKELLPLIPTILNGLYRIYCATPDSVLRNAILELCLTIPARLSSLLPHMSLLLRIIIPALQSNKGELVNLGLRTLEFWVDNLNPEFLYPILSKQTNVLTELMTALTDHLRPAPYPYGLLTLRLLGKLGGKNRRFLREPVDLVGDCLPKDLDGVLAIECSWPKSKVHYIEATKKETAQGETEQQGSPETKTLEKQESREEAATNDDQAEGGVGAAGESKEEEDGVDLFELPLPLDRAIEVLRMVVLSPKLAVNAQDSCDDSKASNELEQFHWDDFRKVWTAKMEKVDFTYYCVDVMEETKQHQAEAAFAVVRSALAAVIEVGDGKDFPLHAGQDQENSDGQSKEAPTELTEQGIAELANTTDNSMSQASCIADARDSRLMLIGSGLMYASLIDSCQEEAWMLLRGYAAHVFAMVSCLSKNILRIDANGSLLVPDQSPPEKGSSPDDCSKTAPQRNMSEKEQDAKPDSDNDKRKPTSLKPFGYFKFTGPFRGKANPFVLNEALADFLCDQSDKTQKVGTDLLKHLLELTSCLEAEDAEADASKTVADPFPNTQTGSDMFFENLLSQLCEKSLSKPWNMREGAYEGICMLIDGLGASWGRRYEMEIMQVAISAVKIAPREVATAAVASFDFFARVCVALYGVPEGLKDSKDKIFYDALAISEKKRSLAEKSKHNAEASSEGEASAAKNAPPEKNEKAPSEPKATVKDTCGGDKEKSSSHGEEKKGDDSDKPGEISNEQTLKGEQPETVEEEQEPSDQTVCKEAGISPSETVVKLLLGEMASSKQLLRVAVRFALRHFVFNGESNNEDSTAALSSHASTVKRVLFSRSLRILPLPEQVGVIEALAFLVEFAPGLISVADQHLLAFLSELLKMSSIADGEMSDSNLLGLSVDKNGYATSSKQNTAPTRKLASLSHASGLFLRKECLLHMETTGNFIVLPEELPHGIQLRVSALKLFRAVTRHHADEFFDADSSTPIGNIRPHVISLLFRSLISNPPQAVLAAHEALRDVLSLSIQTNDGSDGAKAQSRLPKELLHTCIRPVLLHLRDHTRLTVPLLSGLSRLLSLLSSWFNKTLGEKLLDHLQKWTDPDRIISRKIWREGDEPAVAAAILDLFPLLPHASNFVEPLVKTTIKLEHALPRFKPRGSTSLYRPPLARYLNRHCQYTVGFFFPRLRNPIYSGLFQDIVAHEESDSLRLYLSGRQCSVTLLNVCFERPLAIIRSEKAPSSTGTPPTPPKSASEILAMHGITVGANLTSKSGDAAVLKQDIEAKQKRVKLLQQEAVRKKELLQTKLSSSSSASSSESQGAIGEAKRQHQLAQAVYEKEQTDLNESKQKYASMIAQPNATTSSPAEIGKRQMTIEALELQYQGFKLVETLVANDAKYLHDHNDVVRAFRWLWRSKGRHLRLQHEESMPPRFHGESKLLASFLVSYAKAFPSDVDVLFEMIRIFVQPTTSDYLYVRRFLEHTVSDVLTIDRKKQVMQLFFSLLAGDGSDETKVLSIQLILLPMFSNSMKQGVNSDATKHKVSDEATSSHSPESKLVTNGIVDSDTARKFVKEVLFRDGSPTACGERLKIELLKLTTVLLESNWEDFAEHRTDIVKFPWSLLKSEHVSCKHWAYVCVCQFISVYADTPAKVILQVYVALLRLHQPEGKEMIRSALEVLVPVLTKRLSEEDFRKAIEYTNKIMYEEGNSVSQLAHIWHIIVKTPDIFYSYRDRFVRHMINSVHRLGLPPNCPNESRALTLSIVELVLGWEARQQHPLVASPSGDPLYYDAATGKRSLETGDQKEDTRASKRLKNVEGESVPSDAATSSTEDDAVEETLILDQSMIDTIVNFLVRLELLIADSKADGSQLGLGDRATALFRSMVSRWKNCKIHPIYFDKVVSMCVEENKAANTPGAKPSGRDKKVKEKNKSKAGGKGKGTKASSSKASAGSTSAKNKEESRTVSTPLLSACLDIFTILIEEAPQNTFLSKNSKKIKDILGPCIARAISREGRSIRKKLKKFLILLLSCQEGCELDRDDIAQLSVLLEKPIVAAVNPGSTSSSSSSNRATESTVQDGQGTKDKSNMPEFDGFGGSCPAHFSLEIIEEVRLIRPEIVERFSHSLVALADKLSEKHTREASSNQRHVPSAAQKIGSRGSQELCPTPIAGIIEEACSVDNSQSVVSGNSKPTVVNDMLRGREVPALGTALQTLTCCLRLISESRVPLTFSSERRTFFKILDSLLDLSDSVQVLMTTVLLVGKWLVTDEGPLTSKERKSFLWKIASFDFNGLSDVTSQPVADLVACIVLALHHSQTKATDNGLLYFKFCDTAGIRSKSGVSPLTKRNAGTKPGESAEMLLGRSLVACLLSAHPLIRSRLMGVYGTQARDFSDAEEALLSLGVRFGCHEADDLACVGIPGRSPLDVLWQLCHSDYEGLGGRFWIVIFVDLLLASSDHGGGVRLAAPQGVSGKSQVGTWLPLTSDSAASSKAPEALVQCYHDFCSRISKEKSESAAGLGRCVAAVRTLAHGDSGLSQRLFRMLLASAWGTLPNDYLRLELVPSMESLLSRPYYSQFMKRSLFSSPVSMISVSSQGRPVRMNVIKAFLRAIGDLKPMPSLNTDLLMTLAENYAWNEVLYILEHQYSVVLGAGNGDAQINSMKENYLAAIRSCYRQLGETGMHLDLSSVSCVLSETKWALSLDRHDMIKEALGAYNGLIDLAENADAQLNTSPTDLEMNLWEERWIGLQKEMSQWGVVADYANSTQDPRLLLETAWKSQNWDTVRKLCSNASLVAAMESGDPIVKMSEIFLAIAQGKLSDVENLHAQTAQLCLYGWQKLPTVSHGSHAHISLLQLFHRLVELRESGQIMVETSNHSGGRTLPDLKNLLSAWRHRLPNEYERLSVWDDLFLWRSHMFSAITSNFQSVVEPGTLATLHDRPWTSIRMAKTARKQGMREVSLLSLNKLTDCAMDVSDAFSKLREQILVYDNPESNLERTGGLNLVNTTNLSFFDSSQKSELFRLKARFLSSLGGRSKANQAYCHAVQICPSYSRAWVSWGGLCSSLGDLTEKQREQKASSGSSEGGADAASAAAKKVAQYLAQSMGCYLEAIQCDAHEWSRIHLPRCLWMLAKDGSSPGVLCQTLETRGSALPSWVWLPWIPQLLTSLCRIEGRAVKTILTGLVKSYPQALYFSLRAYFLERRDVERSRTSSSTPGQHQGSVAHAEELMSSLRRAHPTLWTSLEAILEELIVRFRPSYEEELLATITALLERAESQMNHPKHTDKNENDGDAVLSSVSKTLGRISAKFFNVSSSDSHPNKKDERARKTAAFKGKYKNAFETDFSTAEHDKNDGSRQQPKVRLKELLARLKKWKRLLETQVSSTPQSLPLIESSPPLALFSSDAPDLWAGSCDPLQSNSPSLDLEQPRKSEDGSVNQSSTSSSAAAATTAAAAAALSVATAASVEGVGGHYGGGSACIEIPGQYVPNKTSSHDSKPNPELHAKLIRFESNIQVIRRNEQLVRRIGMVGSDGKRYRFLLQFAIPYWTRTDERTSQLHYLMDKVLRRGIKSSREYLSVQPSAVIPIAQRLRMTAEDDSRLSLDDTYREACEKQGKIYDAVGTYFQDQVARILEDDKEKGTQSEKAAKLKVFQEICREKVDGRMLLKHIYSLMDGPERLFQFRRSFAQQLAADSLLQHAFCVVERTPSRVVFCVRNGRVMSPDFRFGYSNQGFLDSSDLPFRMTANLQHLIGAQLLGGCFVPSMSTIASAMTENQQDLDPAMRLLLRDDIVAWYTSKSMAKSDAKTQDLEKQLADRILKNVSLVQSRFAGCAPRKVVDKSKLEKTSVDDAVEKLLREAADPEKLCVMTPSYQGWL